MAKIERKTQKIFSGNASTDELAVFGTMSTGNPIYTDNIEDLQSAAYEEGWSAAIAANEAPFLEEMNGVQYGLSKQIAYNFQEGIAEYDSKTTYYKGSIIKTLTDDGMPQLYYSLTDDNTGNPVTDTNNWALFNLGGSGGFTPALFQSFISLTKLNHPSLVNSADYSWLNSGYTSAYNALVERYNAGVDATRTVGDITISYKWNAQYAMRIITPEQIANAESIFNLTGEQPYYILDEANARFKLPRFKTIPQFTNDTNSVGDYNEPALPNITGAVRTGARKTDTMSALATGAFKQTVDVSGNNWHVYDNGNNSKVFQDNIFNANDSNPIYQDGATVQPPTTNFLLYFYVGDSQIEETSITGEVLEQINSKLDLDCANISETGRKVFDGQWVSTDENLKIYNLGTTNATIDLSEYLPKDNYAYELLLMISGGSATKSYLGFGSDIISKDYQAAWVSGGGESLRNLVVFPVGADKRLDIIREGASSAQIVALLAYRRIGTNV